MRKAIEQLPESKSGAIVHAGVEEFSQCAYADANTERITTACGISKGLLFHYFGTKKEFYLFCLRHVLNTLTETDAKLPHDDFYGVLFNVMERKMKLCEAYPAETKFLNMAYRESSMEVKTEKDKLFTQYAAQTRAFSEKVLGAAVSALTLKANLDSRLAVQGLTIYTNALINRYLSLYQDEPEKFFLQKETVSRELKSYIDLMLYGIGEEDK